MRVKVRVALGLILFIQRRGSGVTRVAQHAAVRFGCTNHEKHCRSPLLLFQNYSSSLGHEG